VGYALIAFTCGCAAPSLTTPYREDRPTPVTQGCTTGVKGQLAMSRPWAVSAQMMAITMIGDANTSIT
jgi:hypothetical protein